MADDEEPGYLEIRVWRRNKILIICWILQLYLKKSCKLKLRLKESYRINPWRNFCCHQSCKVPVTVVTWNLGIIFRVAGKIFSRWKIVLLEQESVIIIPGARKETVLCNYWKLITFSQTGFQHLKLDLRQLENYL